MLKIKKMLFLACLTLPINYAFAIVNCPAPSLIKCDKNSCTLPNELAAEFNVVSYKGNPNNNYTVRFTSVEASCKEEETECVTPAKGDMFMCFYQVGDAASLTIDWRSQEMMGVPVPPWKVMGSLSTLKCQDDVNGCYWFK